MRDTADTWFSSVCCPLVSGDAVILHVCQSELMNDHKDGWSTETIDDISNTMLAVLFQINNLFVKESLLALTFQ